MDTVNNRVRGHISEAPTFPGTNTCIQVTNLICRFGDLVLDWFLLLLLLFPWLNQDAYYNFLEKKTNGNRRQNKHCNIKAKRVKSSNWSPVRLLLPLQIIHTQIMVKFIVIVIISTIYIVFVLFYKGKIHLRWSGKVSAGISWLSLTSSFPCCCYYCCYCYYYCWCCVEYCSSKLCLLWRVGICW